MKYTITMVINAEVEAENPAEAINIACDNVEIEYGSYINQADFEIVSTYDENGNDIDF